MAGRDLEALAQGLREVVSHDYLRYRIRSTGYQAAAQLMVMRTRDTATKSGQHRPGGVYGFRGVPEAHYSAMAKADRPGAVFNELIKGRHERVAVTQCGSCGAYHAGGAGHVCSGGHLTTPRPGAPTPAATGLLERVRRRWPRA